jgi:hypothetical protein
MQAQSTRNRLSAPTLVDTSDILASASRSTLPAARSSGDSKPLGQTAISQKPAQHIVESHTEITSENPKAQRTKKISSSSTYPGPSSTETKRKTFPAPPPPADHRAPGKQGSERKRSPSSSPPPRETTPSRPSKKNKPVPAPKKGSSLANPSQRARKYKPIEFGSDSD